jgi:O-antigen/teichoic acid export membrane protein
MSSRRFVDKSISNILWAYLSFFSTKALNLIAIVIIAMYVSPAEFGLMAFSLVVLGYFELLQGFGLGAFLISTRRDVEDAAHAVFIFAVTASATIVVVLWLSAEALADFVGEPALAQILRVLSAFLLIESFAQVHSSLLQRELKFRLKIVPEVGRGLVKGFVSIGLAVAGFGVWALVYGHVAGTLAWTLILMIVRPWFPRRLPPRDTFVTAMRFGSNIVLGELCNAIPRTLDQVLIGKILGAAPLGLYALAQRMPQLALKTFGMESIKVVQPVMSQMQPEPEALQRYYYGLVRYAALLIFPAGALLASVTEPLIRLLYAPQWHGMTGAMQLLSVAFALGFLNHLPGAVYKAIGRSDLFVYVAFINLPFAIAAFWISVPHGIEAVASAHIVLVFVLYAPHFIMLRRAIGIELMPTARAAAPGLICALAAAAGAAASQRVAPGADLARLVAAALGGLVVYLAALGFLGPEIFAEGRRIIRRKLEKNSRPKP